MTLEEVVREEIARLKRQIAKGEGIWPFIEEASLTGQILVLRAVLKKAGL